MVINQEIKDITEAIKAAVPAERIYLFGSYAYGTPNKDSDYDFFILIPDGELRPIEVAQTARRSLISLDKLPPVDILADYISRFEERRQGPTMERKIAKDGVILYERTRI
jgi:predicted nucleotidyltransferase